MNGNYQQSRGKPPQKSVPASLLADHENTLLIQLLGNRRVVRKLMDIIFFV